VTSLFIESVQLQKGHPRSTIQCMLSCMPSLTADEPAAYTMERPHGRSEFLLLCDHASNLIPQSLGSRTRRHAALQPHSLDIGVAGVAKHLSTALDATLLLQS
jgi:predicted N-formylglutamate amidohydrolase